MQKKKYIYIILLIICTLFTTYTLLTLNYQISNFGEEYKYNINEVKNLNENSLPYEYAKDTEEEFEEIKNESENNDDEYEEDDKNSEVKAIEEKEEYDEIKKENDSQHEIKNDKEKNSEDNKTVSVFKVDNKQIIGKLSLSEKARLLYIGNKLPKEDFSKLQSLLKDKNAEKSVVKSYEFLKGKLNKEDFNKIKNILSKYINIGVLEEKTET